MIQRGLRTRFFEQRCAAGRNDRYDAGQWVRCQGPARLLLQDVPTLQQAGMPCVDPGIAAWLPTV